MATLSTSDTKPTPPSLQTNPLAMDPSSSNTPPSPYSVTSLQVHEDTASVNTTTSASHQSLGKNHDGNNNDEEYVNKSITSEPHLESTGMMEQQPAQLLDTPNRRKQNVAKKCNSIQQHQNSIQIVDSHAMKDQHTPLTFSRVRHHDATNRTTAKESVVLAWIDNVAQAPTQMNETSHIIDLDSSTTTTTYGPSHYKIADDNAAAVADVTDDGPTSGLENEAITVDGDPTPIQETKDVFTDAQKMAYVGLCAVTTLEVVHDFKGKEFTYARMSADNWQRKLMRIIYMHMDISPEEIKMVESLSKHNILPTDFVYQFTAQGETATVNVKDLQGHQSSTSPPPPPVPPKDQPSSPSPSKCRSSPLLSQHEIDSTSDGKKNSIASSDQDDSSSLDVDKDNRDEMTDSSGSAHSEPINPATLPPLPRSRSNSTIDTTSIDGSMLSSVATLSINSNSSTDEDDGNERSSTAATNMDKYEAPEHYVIDLRWTVMCDLFLICLSLENYDARSRVFIHRMADYLSLDWHQVLSFERRITQHLLQVEGAWETQSSVTASTTLTSVSTSSSTMVDPSQLHNTKERTSRNKQRKKRRYVMIGLATIGGGLILGLSAGLMAPVIAGGLGALLTTVGVSGTSTFLGGATGIGLITSAATLAGSRLGAKSMNKRMKAINTFEFLPIHVNHQASCIISVTGWLPRSDNKEEAATLPFSPLDSVMGDHYTLYWEPEMLEELGSAFKIFATEAVTFSVQQALGHTIMGALLAGLAWPLALTKLGYLVDNPWANGLDRARSAGLILADTLMNRNLGSRPVTLVGYSLGARVIFYCLVELARVNAYGLVENVALFGAPVSASKVQWRDATSIVAGRVINGYATNDWLLGFLFRATNAGSTLVGNNVAGLHALEMIEGNRVQNMDCTDLIKGHLSYRMAMPKLLKRAGFMVTKEEIAEKKEKDMLGFVMKKSGSQENADIGTSRTSSLSSGTASIQLPSKQQTATTMEHSLSIDHNTSPSSSSSTTTKECTGVSPRSSSPLENDTHQQRQGLGSFTQQLISSSSSSSAKPSAPLVEGVSDMDIIADIIANATAAASSKAGTYSSMSSGKASITSTPTAPTTTAASTSATMTKSNSSRNRGSSGFFGFTRSRSETTQTSASAPTFSTDTTAAHNNNTDNNNDTNTTPVTTNATTSDTTTKNTTNRSSLSFWSRNSKKSATTNTITASSSSSSSNSNIIPADPQQALVEECGVEIKEIKTTLGKMVVPGEVVHPMPKVNLEMPQHARINR